MKLTSLDKKDRQKYLKLKLKDKLKLSRQIIEKTFKRFGAANLAVAATGGKDSTLLLWLIKKVVEKQQADFPQIVFIDEGDIFEETKTFMNKLAKDWQLTVSIAHNQDVSSQAKKLGDMIKVSELNQHNQAELKKLGFKGKEFSYEPESLIGNHLMKTVVLNIWLEKNKKTGLFVGVRWDEQEARSEDDFWRRIDLPPHYRVEPILHLSEKEVWQITRQNQIPFVSLYQKGYRSLGAKTTTEKVSQKPAWNQDLENTSERAGRRQDKEDLMERLRSLGYM